MFYSAMEENSGNMIQNCWHCLISTPCSDCRRQGERICSLISSLEKSCTSKVPFKQAIHKGHQTSALCTRTLLENEAKSSGLLFFKTESVEVLQYSLKSALTALRSGCSNFSRTLGCWKSELATVFQFYRQRLTITDLVLSSKERWLSTWTLGATITTFSWLVCFPSKSSTFRRSHLWCRSSTFEVSSFSSVDTKFNVFFNISISLVAFLGLGASLRRGNRAWKQTLESSWRFFTWRKVWDHRLRFSLFLLRFDAMNS